jgi:hypothetical protein
VPTNLWRKEDERPVAFAAFLRRRLSPAIARADGPGAGLIRFDGTNQIRF